MKYVLSRADQRNQDLKVKNYNFKENTHTNSVSLSTSKANVSFFPGGGPRVMVSTFSAFFSNIRSLI